MSADPSHRLQETNSSSSSSSSPSISVAVEICVSSTTAVQNALRGGADRIEVCSSLVEGGVTPSYGMLVTACEMAAKVDDRCVEVVALIRPREGDFFYSDQEIDVMLKDIQAAKTAGAHGVAIGALDRKGSIVGAYDTIKALILEAKGLGLKVTFHRAFDVATDLEEGARVLCSMGVDRILTSGRCNTAVEGVAALRKLQQIFGHQVGVICAGGVNASNVKYLVETSGVRQVHASCRAGIQGAMQFGTECQIGPTIESVQWLFRNGNIYCTDETKVSELVAAVSRQIES